MATNRRGAVSTLPLLKGVAEPVRVTVMEAAHTRHVDSGAVIFSESEPASSFFVLLSGSVKLAQLTEEGEAVVFRLLGRGDAFGTVSVLGDATYPVSAIAVTRASIVQWPAAVMRRFLELDPQLTLNVLRSVSDRLQALRLQYRQLATENVERRMARVLLTLAQRAGTRVSDGVLLDLPLSREDVAQLTGTTVFTISRIVSRWEGAGIVRAGRQRLVIRQPSALLAIATISSDQPEAAEHP
jgi:CRP-like cAMP-binding protein